MVDYTPRFSWLPPGSRGLALLVACVWLVVPDSAAAVMISLDVEFDEQLTGEFATLEIVQDGSALRFTLALETALGPDADLHEFYFNLAGDFSGVFLTTTDMPQTDYSLSVDPPVRGGAGSSFDFGVSFGNGAGPKGNGVLKTASFTLMADQSLTVADLAELSSAAGESVSSHMVAHIQGTNLVEGSDSETVGGVVPEPSTALLLGSGVAALAAGRRRFASTSQG